MGDLADRQFESTRRVSPGRTVPKRNRAAALEREEYAVAVVDPTGQPWAAQDFYQQLLEQLQLNNRLLAQILIQLGGFYSEGGLSVAA